MLTQVDSSQRIINKARTWQLRHDCDFVKGIASPPQRQIYESYNGSMSFLATKACFGSAFDTPTCINHIQAIMLAEALQPELAELT